MRRREDPASVWVTAPEELRAGSAATPRGDRSLIPSNELVDAVSRETSAEVCLDPTSRRGSLDSGDPSHCVVHGPLLPGTPVASGSMDSRASERPFLNAGTPGSRSGGGGSRLRPSGSMNSLVSGGDLGALKPVPSTGSSRGLFGPRGSVISVVSTVGDARRMLSMTLDYEVGEVKASLDRDFVAQFDATRDGVVDFFESLDRNHGICPYRMIE